MAEPVSITPQFYVKSGNDTLYSLGNIDENPLEDFLLVTVDPKKKETRVSFVMNHPTESEYFNGTSTINLGNYLLTSVSECTKRIFTMPVAPTFAEMTAPSYKPKQVTGPEISCKIDGKIKGDGVQISGGPVMRGGTPVAIVLSPDGTIGLVSSSSAPTINSGVAVPGLEF